MNLLNAMLIFGAGVWVAQDGLASIWHYRDTEKWTNHQWRIYRVIAGVVCMVAVILEIM